MYQSPRSFQAPLAPRDYCGEESHEREARAVFESSWLLMGLTSSISRPGQYLSGTLGSIPVLVRNFNGELVALRNVCTHRHCSLVSRPHGYSERLKCPFHGWEFGADGRTRRIPAAKNFPDFDRERFRLQSFPVECCGELIFVRATDEGPTLREWLGDLFPKFESWTTQPNWKPAMRRRNVSEVNWKIPVEISLESYHIPEVHPNSFGEDPGEEKSEHAFGNFSSSFFTSFNTPRFIDRLLKVYETFILKILGVPFTGRYEHHHVFPNLLISHTDSLTLIQRVQPLSRTSSASDIWHYARQSVRRNPFSRFTAAAWGHFTGLLTWQILKEDIGILPAIQRGEQSAVDTSLLGRCEERLFSFQKFVRDCTGTVSPVNAVNPETACHPCDSAEAPMKENVYD